MSADSEATGSAPRRVGRFRAAWYASSSTAVLVLAGIVLVALALVQFVGRRPEPMT